jgi:hypothetical protein
VRGFLSYLGTAIYILILSVLWAVVVLAFFIAAVDLIGAIAT